MTTGNKFKNKRIQRNMSQNELAAFSGVSKSMISAIERDRRTPSVDIAKMIARVLRCTVDELIGEAS